MDTREAPSLSALRLRAQRAATRRATHPFLMATIRTEEVSGTHIFTRHPELTLSLCRNLTRDRMVRHARALVPLQLDGVTCAVCLVEFESRVNPR